MALDPILQVSDVLIYPAGKFSNHIGTIRHTLTTLTKNVHTENTQYYKTD